LNDCNVWNGTVAVVSVIRGRVEAAWEIVFVFRDRDIGGVAINSVEDLDVLKLTLQLALTTDI